MPGQFKRSIPESFLYSSMRRLSVLASIAYYGLRFHLQRRHDLGVFQKCKARTTSTLAI